jgi:hypothetical protein
MRPDGGRCCLLPLDDEEQAPLVNHMMPILKKSRATMPACRG